VGKAPLLQRETKPKGGGRADRQILLKIVHKRAYIASPDTSDGLQSKSTNDWQAKKEAGVSKELRPDSRGKVRDIYDCGDELLMVASDRISAFDVILPDEIPYKGEILTRISAFWFNRFRDLIPNHMISVLPEVLESCFEQPVTHTAQAIMHAITMNSFFIPSPIRVFAGNIGFQKSF